MFNSIASFLFRRLGGVPCFRIYGKVRRERDWRVVDVFATARRNLDSRWPAPIFRGTCITWTASIISVGLDFAEQVLREQLAEPASARTPGQCRWRKAPRSDSPTGSPRQPLPRRQ